MEWKGRLSTPPQEKGLQGVGGLHSTTAGFLGAQGEARSTPPIPSDPTTPLLPWLPAAWEWSGKEGSVPPPIPRRKDCKVEGVPTPPPQGFRGSG